MKILHTSTQAYRGFLRSTLGKGLRTVCLGGLLVTGICSQARALVYDVGTLNFNTSGQSMWGSGSGTSITESKFLGVEWADKTVSAGGFVLGTGAEASLSTSGRVGIEAGFELSSGTVDAAADFSVAVDLPDELRVNAGRFFNLNSASTFTNGTIATQSPWIEAYVNGVLELSGSISAKGCLALAGCQEGTTSLPTIDYHPEVFALNPNGLSFLGVSLGAAGGGISVAGDLVSKQIKVETSSGVVLKDYATPAVTEVELGEMTFELPNISTEGENTGATITSSGRDTVLNTKLDLDGVVAMATGFTPSVEMNLVDTEIFGKKFQIGASLDLIDVKVGPTIDMFQEFELTPTLMVELTFDHAVEIAGYASVTSYSGAWDRLPDLALLETTTITPTFWLEATMTNLTGVDFGFELDLAALSASFETTVGDLELPEFSIGPIWEDTIPLGSRFGGLNLFNQTFALNGFNRIMGNAFTLFVDTDHAPVPEPGTMLLIGIGLAMIGLTRRPKNESARLKQ